MDLGKAGAAEEGLMLGRPQAGGAGNSSSGATQTDYTSGQLTSSSAQAQSNARQQLQAGITAVVSTRVSV